MKNTKQFIEDAIEGGWDKSEMILEHHLQDYEVMEIALLDPLAWKAVSKTRDWNQGKHFTCPSCDDGGMSADWRYYMHQFIESIAMNLSIEEALGKIV